MPSIKESILQGTNEVEKDIFQTLDGMDYCLDWKPDATEWSAREILWHILEDPEGGIPNNIDAMIKGSLPELTIIADETHINAQRQAMDLNEIKQELKKFFDRAREVVGAATDGQIREVSTSCWFPLRNHREDRTAQNLLEGLYLRHWRNHILQLKELRKSLGMD
jgi:hypothetical protein